MPRRTPGQERLPALNVAKVKGRVRAAAAREIAAARAKGLEVSPASVTVIYVLADQLDAIERDQEDRYLLPQLVTRLLEERRAAHLLPDRPSEELDDMWGRLSAEFTGLEAGAQP